MARTEFRKILKDMVEGVRGGYAGTIMEKDGITVEDYVKEGFAFDIETLGVECGKERKRGASKIMIPASAPGGMKEKRDRLELDFDFHGIDGFLVTNITNVRYISGFTGTSGCVLLAAKDKGFFFTDGRYKLQARSEVKEDRKSV